MTAQDQKDIIRRFFEEVVNQQKLEGVEIRTYAESA